MEMIFSYANSYFLVNVCIPHNWTQEEVDRIRAFAALGFKHSKRYLPI